MKKIARFHVVLEKEPEDGGFSVYVPALPGCASQGETEDEALSNIREAIEMTLEHLRACHLPVPREADIIREVEIPTS
ncbi:MAG: type II toxin-antitoxin system HicB family antitoxin [Elusimicrobia bacterium]|nr:type II toxin-antitoxin system HicB family antitoxin [Elusimicrobiota bacterium]